LGIDATDGSIVIATNTPAVGYKLTVNGKTQTTDLNVTGTLTAGTISGTSTNANNILLTADNTAGTYYIPFAKTSGTSQKPLFIDDTTGPLK
jgi:hypothetical protein